VVDTVDGDVVLVANNVPPVDAEYHFTVVPFDPGVAVIVPVPHKVVFDAVGAAGIALAVTVTDVREAVSHVVVLL
jgi:hypothetical protein